MSDICEWFTQYIDLAEDVVIIKFSDGTTKTVKRGLYLKDVEDNIRKMLIDQVDRPTGHWIAIDEEPHEVWECDNCGFVIDGSGCIDPYDYRDTYKFCPNCGARMVEPQESEE